MTQEATKEPEIVTSVRLTISEHAFLKELARRERRSLSDQIRFWLDRAQEQEEQAA